MPPQCLGTGRPLEIAPSLWTARYLYLWYMIVVVLDSHPFGAEAEVREGIGA